MGMSVLTDMYIQIPELGLQALGMRVYISGRTQVYMLQLLCTTLIVHG